MTTSPHDLLGGRFEVRTPLGSGGMADVYLAHDRLLHRDVAVKILREVTEVDRDRFASEARVLAQLSHESIVTLYDASVADGRPWLALELVDGRTLAEILRDAPLEPRPLAAIAAQVAAGLAHAHARGVVHRDVKPSNVLVTAAGRARLTDFGIARLADAQDDLTRTGHVVGTAAYLAPEQARGERLTGAADVYALGLLVLEAVTGRRSFPGPPLEAALARLHQGPVIPTSLPAGWSGLLAAMTALSPGDRPTAEEAARRLRELGGRDAAAPMTAEMTSHLPVVPPADPRPGRRRPRPPVLLVAAAAVLAVVLGSAFLARGSGQDPAPTTPSGPAGTPDATPADASPSSAPSSPAADVEPAADPAVDPAVEPPASSGPGAGTSPPSGPGKSTGQGKTKGKSKGKSNGKAKGRGKG